MARESHRPDRRYLNVFPSDKALARLREKVRLLTGSDRCFQPTTEVIGEVNRLLRGWSQYFSHGYPRVAFRKVNWFVQSRLWRHLHRRSQRPFRPPEGMSWPAQLQRLGLRRLQPLRPPLEPHHTTPLRTPSVEVFG